MIVVFLKKNALTTRKLTSADAFTAALGSIQTRIELHNRKRPEKKVLSKK
jgi:hypothetical protein